MSHDNLATLDFINFDAISPENLSCSDLVTIVYYYDIYGDDFWKAEVLINAKVIKSFGCEVKDKGRARLEGFIEGLKMFSEKPMHFSENKKTGR